jgi:hypothetical protein
MVSAARPWWFAVGADASEGIQEGHETEKNRYFATES